MESTAQRKIIHIDMDCFFAACEVRQHPELRGKPLAVGFDGPRSVVSTASYEARQFGVHSAMPIATAKRLCPQLVVVPCHFELYKSVSRQIHAIFRQYTDLIEPISLDEAFLDVTHNKPGIALAQDIAVEIKQQILAQTGLTASAGISYCKFLAKIASDWRKPDGLTIIHPAKALHFIEQLRVEQFWGVGQKTAAKMHSLGIFDGQQLRATPLSTLISHFGKQGRVFYDFARGIDPRPVVAERVRKSVGCEETFTQDIFDEADVSSELEKLLAQLLHRIEKDHFEGRTLVLKVKYFDFAQITRSITAEQPLASASAISPLLAELLRQVDYSRQRPIRLLGLAVANPHLPAAPQGRICLPDLFDPAFDEWL